MSESEGRPRSGYFVAAVVLGVAAVASAVALGVLLYKQYAFAVPVIAGWATASSVVGVVSATWIGCLISACRRAQKVGLDDHSSKFESEEEPRVSPSSGEPTAGDANAEEGGISLDGTEGEEDVSEEEPPVSSSSGEPTAGDANAEEGGISLDGTEGEEDVFFDASDTLPEGLETNSPETEHTQKAKQDEWNAKIDAMTGQLQTFLNLFVDFCILHMKGTASSKTKEEIASAINALAMELQQEKFIEHEATVTALISYPCEYLITWDFNNYSERLTASAGAKYASEKPFTKEIKRRLQNLLQDLKSNSENPIQLTADLCLLIFPYAKQYFGDSSGLLLNSGSLQSSLFACVRETKESGSEKGMDAMEKMIKKMQKHLDSLQ